MANSDVRTKVASESGRLVWVRRRNGIWWPGQILSVDQVPQSHMAKRRSGTPVMLLGSEDASLDWYNIEKSKRVKPFRCEEFDECIENAKAGISTNNLSKIPVKYGRRKYAILQALQLEDAQQSEEKPNGPSRLVADEETEHKVEGSIELSGKSNLRHELFHSGVPSEDKGQSSQKREINSPNNSEDDGTERAKRMRRVEDILMGAASDRRTTLTSGVHKAMKKKTPQLENVLESTAQPLVSRTVSDNVCKRSFLIDLNKSPESTEDGESSLRSSDHATDALPSNRKEKEKEISSMPDDSDELLEEPVITKQLAGVTYVYIPCATQKPRVVAGAQSSQSGQVESVPSINKELNVSGSTSSGATDNDVTERGKKEVGSKWMLKGKRKLRNARKCREHGFKRSVNNDKSNEYLAVLEPKGASASQISDDCAFPIKSKLMTETPGDEVQGYSTHILHKKPQMMVPTSTAQRLLPYRQSRYKMNPKYQSSEFTVYDPDSYLHDVGLEARASSRPRSVPYISRTSKLTGQPIIYKHNVEEKTRLAQKVKGPSISCVPLKVVYSRINAALR